MNKKAIWSLIVVVIVIILIAVLMQSGKSGQNDDKRVPPTEPIKIGVLYMLSGDGAAWGENAKKGTDLAVEEYNTTHPDRPVTLVYADTKTEAKEAISAFNKVTSLDHVQYILGPLFQHEIAAVDPLIEQKGIPVVAPGYFAPTGRKDMKNPLLMWLDAMIETDRIADYVIKQGTKTVSIINTTDPWESAVGAEFEKHVSAAGVKVLARETVQTNAVDVRLPITKILSVKPEAVFLGTYLQYVHSLKALGEQGYKGKIYSIEIDEYLAGETKNFVKEVLAINPDKYSTDFSAKFQQKYNMKPGLPAGHAYDATNLLLDSISKNPDPKAVLADLRTRTSFDGVSGKVEFTPDGKTLFPTALNRVTNGNLEWVASLK